MNHPSGVSLDPESGAMYFADFNNNRVRVILNGMVSTIAGSGEAGFEDGPADAATMDSPIDVAFDPTTGDLYFADYENYRVRVVSSKGVVSTVAGGESGSSIGQPVSLSLDLRNGRLYFADTASRISALSDGVVSVIAGTEDEGYEDGPVDRAKISNPSGLALDPRNDDLYFVDQGSRRIRVISAGFISTVAGSGDEAFKDGFAADAAFTYPSGLIIDAHSATIYVSDGNYRIRAVELMGRLGLTVCESAALATAAPRKLVIPNSRGLTPLEMATQFGESEQVVEYLKVRTNVANIVNELNPQASDEKFKFWYDFWDEL